MLRAKKLKSVLFLSFFFFGSCKYDQSQPPVGENSISFSPNRTDSIVPMAQLGCGTSQLCEAQLKALKDPDNFKEISFNTTKQKFFSFLSLAEKKSFVFNSFDTKGLREFYIPTAKDSIWLTWPVTADCYIYKSSADSFPARISYQIGVNKIFKVDIAADSAITNQLMNIVVANRIGKITKPAMGGLTAYHN